MAKDSRKLKPAYWEPDEKWLEKHKQYMVAIKAVHEGAASPDQQQKALGIIMEVFCARNQNQYYESERDTTFALGRKFVGDLIAGAINAKIGQIKESP